MWLLKAAERGRKAGTPREQRIAREVFAVLEGSSDVYKWIEERHKVATANRSVSDSLLVHWLYIASQGRRSLWALIGLLLTLRSNLKVR